MNGTEGKEHEMQLLALGNIDYTSFERFGIRQERFHIQ